MVCYFTSIITYLTRHPHSAKVVVDMIISELAGRQWAIPEWLPERYLTWNRIEATHPEEQ